MKAKSKVHRERNNPESPEEYEFLFSAKMANYVLEREWHKNQLVAQHEDGSVLCAVIPNNPQEVNARYLHQYLQFYKDTLLVPLMKGAANVSLSMRDIAKVEIPLPDFDTQTALAKIFVEAQEKQKQLSAEFEKQTEYAKQLRQNILQEAIEGKLTAEWRKTHPAEKGNPDFDAQALFGQIQKEK